MFYTNMIITIQLRRGSVRDKDIINILALYYS